MSESKSKSTIGSPASMPLVNLVDQRWYKSDKAEAQLLIDIMLEFYNSYWSAYCWELGDDSSPHPELVHQNEEGLRSSAATGIADYDGTVERQLYTAKELNDQRRALQGYRNQYADMLTAEQLELLDRAEQLIQP